MFGTIFQLLVLLSILPTATEQHPESYQAGLNVEKITNLGLQSSVHALTEYRAILKSIKESNFQRARLQILDRASNLDEYKKSLEEKNKFLKENHFRHPVNIQTQLKGINQEMEILSMAYSVLLKSNPSEQCRDLATQYITNAGAGHKQCLYDRNYKEQVVSQEYKTPTILNNTRKKLS